MTQPALPIDDLGCPRLAHGPRIGATVAVVWGGRPVPATVLTRRGGPDRLTCWVRYQDGALDCVALAEGDTVARSIEPLRPAAVRRPAAAGAREREATHAAW